MLDKIIIPDSKGRITLGPLTDSVRCFSMTITGNRLIILHPFSKIPSSKECLTINKTLIEVIEKNLLTVNRC